MPVPSFPTVDFQRTVDRSFYTFHLSCTNSLVLLALAFFIAAISSWAWIKNEMTIEGFVTRIYPLFITFITSVEQLSYYLRLSRLLEIATAILLDANDARGTSPRPSGGMSNPISAALRSGARGQRSLGVNSRPPEMV